MSGQYNIAGSENRLTEAGKPSPMAMAQAIVDLPVPLGPIIMLRSGPGANSIEV